MNWGSSMAKRNGKTVDIASLAVLVRCFKVSDFEDSDTLVACAAGPLRVINEEEKQKLLAFAGGHWSQGLRYVLVEPLGEKEIQALAHKAAEKAQANRIASEKRRLDDEKRRKIADLRRKQKRLEQLEARAKEG